MTRIALLLAAVVAAAGLGAGLFFALRPGDALAACREGGGIVGAEIGGPFELVSETGETVRSETLIDRPTLLYFGYTFCPDFCPRDAAVMAAARERLAQEGVDVRTLFVTIDPERDTAERLAAFTDALDPEMIGLTGDAEQIDAAARAWKVYYAKAGDDPDYYMMDHSTFTYLVFPEIGFVDFFRHNTPPEDIAARAACYVEALG